ncbi:sn-glycerol-3-phosphate ABC transporter ATP-binding protein UgpC [bacterium]|nr:sn-glycerol-3-phosphate ABC transporter ATP-binding protein UgpC [bacterium]
MATVDLQSVSKIYTSKDKNTLAVDQVSFEVKDKTITVLVGPSGCGKTTVLRMIAGLEKITKGDIRIDGRVINSLPARDRDIAMVFQNYALYPHMNVFDNLAFGLKISHVPKDQIEKRVSHASELLQLSAYLKNKPRELSGGQRQRVAVGRAIVRNPKVLLFDEPLSNLDAKLRVEMRMELMRMQKELGWTMIYVTHDQLEAMTMADSMIVMNGGKIQQTGSAMSMYQQPVNQFVAEFIGTPPMNLLKGTTEHADATHFIFDKQRINVNKLIQKDAGNAVILGIRPEHIDFQEIKSEDAKLSATLEFTEHLGNENFYYFRIGNQRIICRSAVLITQSAIGKTFFLKLRPDKMHFFDVQNGNSIN